VVPDISNEHSVSVFRVRQSKCLTLKLEVLYYFRLLGRMHLLTQCNIPEDLNLQLHLCENI
jgi:hypothetical protein